MTPEFYAQQLACLFQGVNPDEYYIHKAAAELLTDVRDPQYGQLSKMAAHIAANLYKAVGEEGSPEYCLFDQLRKSATWFPAFDEYTDPVLAALARDVQRTHTETRTVDEITKSAGVGAMLTGLVGGALKNAPMIGKFGLGMAAATGAGLGGLYWGLNRHANEDDAQTEALKERLNQYRKITNEISGDLQRKGITVPGQVKQTIQNDSGAQFVN
jgi:hypothetical protein